MLNDNKTNQPMAKDTTIHAAINDLLNRQFEIADIRQHLLSSGYTGEQIEAALIEVIAVRKRKISNQVSLQQGSRGMGFIVSGTLILLSILLFDSRSTSQTFTTLRLIFGILLLTGGIILATRPLQDEQI